MKNSTKTAIGAGAALTAVAAATAAGAYWLYGAKDAAKHRKMAKSWMLKARAEAMEAVEKLTDLDKKAYLAAVAGVLEKYKGMAGVAPAEISHMLRDFKDSWTHVEKAHTSASRGTKTAKKAVKKVAKKAKQK